MRFSFFLFLFLLLCCSCADIKEQDDKKEPVHPEGVELMVLGIAQDAGFPQTACQRPCCENLLKSGEKGALVTCLGLVNHKDKKQYMFEASPDFPSQLASLNARSGLTENLCDGVFITHAHMGHYTGLMYLGRESVGASAVPVYSMPRLANYLSENGPWSQLVSLNNIELRGLKSDSLIQLDPSVRIIPLEVPHRDEFSETVGYKIIGPDKSALFIPDIDKWSKWDLDIKEQVAQVDFAFLDATFYRNGEIWGRDMSQIPHPFVEETMNLFDEVPYEEKQKIFFIHLNHTNPLLSSEAAKQEVLKKGFNLAEEGMLFSL